MPAILNQQAVLNINVSQQSFSSFSFLSFFLSFFFYLRKCLSRRAEVCKKVHSPIYCWWNRILSVSLFLFWIHIIPLFRKGRRENSSSSTYFWQVLIFRLLSFTGEWHPQNLAECAFPQKDSVLFFLQETFPGLGCISVNLLPMSVQN